MKIKWTACLLSLCLLLPCVSLTSCGGRLQKFSQYSFEYFDTVTTVTGYAKNQAEFDKVAERILQKLGEYHRLYTIYHRFEGVENLCTVNELVGGAHRTVTVDSRIMELLLYAKEMYEKTDGQVNIAMGSVLSIWHDYREEGMSEPWNAKLPPMDALTEAAKHTDLDCLMLDTENRTVTITDPLMKLDVGAVAKGYAVEMVATWMEESGITGYILNVGGNLRAVGSKGNGEPWLAGIENPDEDSQESYLAYLYLDGKALVTSGSYQRYYTVEGKRYHHIIDPDTLMPAEGFTSVSVLTGSSADGDALSTALFCMTAEEGLALIESLPDTEAMWVHPDGTVIKSSGFSRYEASIQ